MLSIMSSQTTSLLWLTLLYLLPVTVVSTCGNPSTLKPGQRQWISLKVGSVTRSALVYAPSSSSVTDTAKALPLVLNFHGNPSDAEAQADYTEMDASAQRHGFYVVYPQGIDEAFNAGGCCADATADDVGFARALVKYMSDNACVDSKRVFATGWSNGGYMAYYLACLASDVFAAIAPVGGLIGIDPATECSPQFPPRVLAFHETGDPEVSYQGGGDEYLGAQALLAQFAKKQGCDPNNVQVSYQKGEVTCRSHTSCPAGKNATLCTIQRAFHSWPNACSECAGTVDANYVGTTNINGNEEIYQFFAASTIAPTVAPTSKSPTVLPTKAPTTKSPTYVPPTKASPTPSGTPKPPVLFCFPGESTVEVLHATRHSHNGTTSTAVVNIAMRNLQIGDTVKVHGGDHSESKNYARVYSFGHYDALAFGDYLQIHAHGLLKPLEMTKNHMLFVQQDDGKTLSIPASGIHIGDKLVLSSGGTSHVTNITVVQARGAFAPFTTSGTIVVNGVVASNYVSLQESRSDSVAAHLVAVFGVSTPLTMQWLAHVVQAPHRWLCHIHWDAFCATETYTSDGISTWVAAPLRWSLWLLK